MKTNKTMCATESLGAVLGSVDTLVSTTEFMRRESEIMVATIDNSKTANTQELQNLASQASALAAMFTSPTFHIKR